MAQTFLQGLIEGEKGLISVAIRIRIIWSCNICFEKLGYHYCGKVPIDGVRLAYQKIKRKAETSLFQVVSEEDRWDQRAEAAYNDLLYLKQFYESPMGLLSIIVSEEGLVELGFL